MAENNNEVIGYPVMCPHAYSLYVQVYYGTQSTWYDMAASGTITHYVQTYPGATYISGFFHHVKLTGLRPDTTYFYK